MSAGRPADFGGYLRQAREARGISLRQIATSTKIAVRALEALERNDISRLPGGIFTRAFVRAYASSVGLDPEETVREFIARFPFDSVTAGSPHVSRADEEDDIESERHMALVIVQLVAVGILIAIAIVYYLSRPAAPPRMKSTAGSEAAKPASAPASSATTAPSGKSTAEQGQEPIGAALAEGLTMEMSVTGPCWVSATVDGEEVVARTMQPGEQETVRAREAIVVRVGDAGAFEFSLNAVPGRPLGRAGEVVTARIDPSNYRTYLLSR